MSKAPTFYITVQAVFSCVPDQNRVAWRDDNVTDHFEAQLQAIEAGAKMAENICREQGVSVKSWTSECEGTEIIIRYSVNYNKEN